MPTKQLDLPEHLARFDHVPNLAMEPEPGVFVRTSRFARLEDLYQVFDKATGRNGLHPIPGRSEPLRQSCYGRPWLNQS